MTGLELVGRWRLPCLTVLAAVILVSIFSAANGMTLTLPRLFFAMARDRVFFARLAVVHPRFGTPAAAIVGTGLWSAVLVLSGTLSPSLNEAIGSAQVTTAASDQQLAVDIRGTKLPLQLVKPPFVELKKS